MKKTILPFLLLNFICIVSIADPGDSLNVPRKKYFTNRLQGSITLDGIPNEDAWSKVEFGGDFIQWQPNEGKAPSQPTQFKILYDDKFLYVAYWCHDVFPDSVIKRMGRRDQFPGDWVEINLDSYHDSRSGFSFTTSVSGVRSDEFISNNGNNWDVTFNPIWFAKTSMNEKGWTAEIKIPFSQLRYGNEKDKVWGIQVTRRLFRKEERSTWQFIPQTLGVWVSGFGELHGLKDIPFHRQVEIAPYIRAGVDKYKKQAGNPYADGTDHKLSGGLDGKVAVTNDLILDFTVNPDFGQVEADPSQVRIDGFQNFFEEQRPFFVESRSIFNYQLTGSIAGGDYDADLLFYSRRVGSSPHGSPNTTNGEYANSPQNTTILGATKFSGKTKKGLSIGILESITQREMATIYNNGQKRKEMVEPLTNYFVARMQKDYNNANTIIGGIFTAVNREKGLEDILHRKAYTGGVDFVHQWKRQTWYVRGNVIFSHVQGSKEAIHRTQTAFEHLFQRPGASEVEVDANRTSLTGMGSTVKFGKSGGRGGKLGQVLRFETGVTVRSPELELNDIGFMLSANEINHFTWVGLRYPRSFSIFRSAGINYNHWQRWDFSGKKIYQAFNTNGNVNFKNNWFAYTGFTWNTFDISNNALRGASALRRPTGLNISSQIRSDQRKKVYANANTNFFLGAKNTLSFKNYGLTLNYVPTNALNLSLGVNYSNNWRKQDQFVSIRSYNGTQRVIVSEVRQKTLRFTGRFTYNITPDLTIQYYGQPYITRPLYKNFAYVTDALAKNFEDRFQPYTSNQISLSNNVYAIDENTDGSTDYSFGLPDFNFVQFRSNLVARWEYKPGSELFLVWSQSNTANSIEELDTPLFNSLTDNAFANQARNIFLVKWTYRFLR
jgi:hypothetical protein